MNQLQRVVLDVFGLGLRGDAGSIRQLAMRILRSPLGEYGDDPSLREELTRLILEQPPGFTRSVGTSVREPSASDIAPRNRVLLQNEVVLDAQVPVVSAELQTEIDQLIEERRNPEALMRVGLEPTRTLLLVGAPGVGKTMTARYLASKTGLPLVTADLAVMLSSYLGKTGQNIRSALDHARATPCLFLIDEFDAVSKRRDDPTDVGELKRIVNVLLLELERWPAHSLFVAATNHSELLDRAVWRRFDKILRLSPPDESGRAEILRRALAACGQVLDSDGEHLCVAALEGASGSDIVRFVREGVRSSVMRGRNDFGASMREWALQHLQSAALQNDDAARRLYCRVAHDVLGRSHREIAVTLGVSHVTIGKLLKRALKAGRQVSTREGVNGDAQ